MPQNAPSLYEPSSDELRELATAFDGLAGRIEHSKAHAKDLRALVQDMLINYPLEAGRLFCECLDRNGLIELVGYVHGMPDWQYRSEVVERPDGARGETVDADEAEIAFQLRGIAGLFHLAGREACPDAAVAILWLKVIRGWAFPRRPWAFRADLPTDFHPMVSGFDECGPGGEVLSRYRDEQVFIRLRNTPEDQVRAEMWAHADIHAAGCRFLAAQLRTEATGTQPGGTERGNWTATEAGGGASDGDPGGNGGQSRQAGSAQTREVHRDPKIPATSTGEPPKTAPAVGGSAKGSGQLVGSTQTDLPKASTTKGQTVPVPSKTEWLVLQELGNSKHAITAIDLSGRFGDEKAPEGAPTDRKAIGKALQELERYRLAVRKSTRSGWAITDAGRAFLQENALPTTAPQPPH